MPISIVQSKSQGFTTSVTAYSLAFNSNISAGSIIVVACETAAFGPSITFSDTSGDVPTDSGLGIFNDANFGNGQIIAFFSPTAGVAQNITATFSSAPFRCCLWIYEVAGLSSASWDQKSSANGGSGNGASGFTGTLAQAAEFAVGVGATENGTPTGVGSGWTSDGSLNVANGDGAIAMHQITAATTAIEASFTETGGANWLCGVATIKGTTAAPPADTPSSFNPNTFPPQWTRNAQLLRGTAQDFSSSAVETNPHWRPRTWLSQWNVQAALRQNAALDVPLVVTPDTPPPFRPSSWPLQWILNWRLLLNTAQDFSSSAVETNPHWVGKPWPVQWVPLSLLRAVPNDAPAPVQPDTPPHWVGKPWPVQWNLLLALHYNAALDVPPVTPETNTFFVPKTWPVQWVLTQLLKLNTAQDFSSSAVETNVYFIPRTWPPQWNLQVSLLRGTAQDFSSLPPATNPVYARYGAAHGIGMLSAIPGEIPS